MISVVKVFNTIRDLCNEDQRGFVTPEVFNSFAEVAQEAVYEKMKDDRLNTARLRRSNMDLGGIDSRARETKDMMSDYLDEIEIRSNIENEFERAVFKKPSDLDKIVSVDTFDGSRNNLNGGYSCDLVYDVEKSSMIRRSNLSSPTDQYPVALIYDNIEVIPETVSSIKLTYYRRPSSRYVTSFGKVAAGSLDRGTAPRYSVSKRDTRTGLMLLDARASRNFDLPKDYYQELVAEIASMMGVRLRDALISTYAAQEQAQA